MGDTVRKMMRKCLTNKLMSKYSLKGRPGKGKAGKTPFEGLAVYNIIIRKLAFLCVFLGNSLPCTSVFVQELKDPNGE